MPPSLLRQDFSLGYFDVDPKLRVSPMAYWRILQNAAAAHASLLGASTEELRRQGLTWMLSRMVLHIHEHPSYGDPLHVETWPSTRLRGVRAYRDFVVKDRGGEVLASAASLWVMVDLATRKPVRVPEAIVQLRHDPGYTIPAFRDALPTLRAPDAVPFRALWSDSDQNEHVNNVAYVRWGVDALPTAFLEAHTLRAFEVHYLREVALGEEVEVHTALDGGLAQQCVYDAAGQAVASLASQWEELPAYSSAPSQTSLSTFDPLQ